MTNFLTEEDEANLNATYTAIREAGMKKMMEKFETGELANVTLEEAMQVVEYSVKMEVCAWLLLLLLLYVASTHH
jgi:hypothetical protein